MSTFFKFKASITIHCNCMKKTSTLFKVSPLAFHRINLYVFETTWGWVNDKKNLYNIQTQIKALEYTCEQQHTLTSCKPSHCRCKKKLNPSDISIKHSRAEDYGALNAVALDLSTVRTIRNAELVIEPSLREANNIIIKLLRRCVCWLKAKPIF